MKSGNLSLIADSLLSFPSASEAQTQDRSLDISANAGFVSEYSSRGVDQSDESIAFQGGFDLAHDSGLYTGVWSSSVDFNDGDEASVEVDIYGGYVGNIKGLIYDVGVLYYIYPGADSSLDYDYGEGLLSLGYDFDHFFAKASVYYSPEFSGSNGNAFYYKGNVDVPLPHDFKFLLHAGRQEVEENDTYGRPDYNEWSAGLGYNLASFDLLLKYIDSDLSEPDECADGCRERVIFGVSRSF